MTENAEEDTEKTVGWDIFLFCTFHNELTELSGFDPLYIKTTLNFVKLLNLSGSYDKILLDNINL